MTRERAIHELSRSEYDVVYLLMLTTKFDNTRWPWRRAVATSVVGVAADIDTSSQNLKVVGPCFHGRWPRDVLPPPAP